VFWTVTAIFINSLTFETNIFLKYSVYEEFKTDKVCDYFHLFDIYFYKLGREKADNKYELKQLSKPNVVLKWKSMTFQTFHRLSLIK
jgi:hypothetical protein